MNKKKRSKKRITIQVRNTLALPDRANTTVKLLRNLCSLFAELFTDENFITLLRAESRTMIPAYLRTALEEAKTRHDIA